jgi:asparagine synthase (glutamine-hydrolysing)
VALNGDAGDENFAGYRRYVSSDIAQRFDRLPFAVRHAIGRLIATLPALRTSRSLWSRGIRLARRLSDSPEERYAQHMMRFDAGLQAELCHVEFLKASGNMSSTRLLSEAFINSEAIEPVERLLDIDVQRYLPDCLLVKVDIATMAHGLEGRSPMLDHEFMEFVAALPAHFKLRGRQTKYIFKRAARELIPADIIDRPKKGFSVPLEAWFRNELRDMSGDLLLDGHLASRGYFRMDVVQRMLQEHWTGRARWHNQLWSLLILECWHRRFIDGADSSHSPPSVSSEAFA